MHLEKQGNYLHPQAFALTRPFIQPLFDERVYLGLQFRACRRIGKDFFREPAPLFFGNNPMDNVIGIESLDADVVQELRHKRFPAGDRARKGYAHVLFSVRVDRRRFIRLFVGFAHGDLAAAHVHKPGGHEYEEVAL